MTKAEAKKVKKGDIIVDRRGREYTVLRVCEVWKGALLSSELETTPPDFYDFAVKGNVYFRHTEVRCKA